MATVTRAKTDRGECIVLHGVRWETYEALLESRESRKGRVLMSYDLDPILTPLLPGRVVG